MHDKAGAIARTVFALDVPQELRNPPLQYDHFDCWYAFSLQPTVDPCEHLLLLIRRYQDPSCPILVCICELLRFVLGYELLSSVPRFASIRHLATHVEPVPLFPIVPCGGPGLVDSCIYPYAHVRMSTPGRQDCGEQAVRFWDHKKPEEQEILGHRGRPPASA